METKRKERKISYSLSLDGYFLMIWIFLGSGCDIYSIHFGPTCLIQSTLVLYKSFWSTSVLFNPLLSYLVYFGLIQSIRSHFGPIRSYLVHSIHFRPIRSSLVLFGLLQFYSNHFGPFLCTYLMGKDRFGLRFPILNPNLLKKYIDGLFV